MSIITTSANDTPRFSYIQDRAKILTALNLQQYFSLYLTGSYFFNNARDNSDIDFFVGNKEFDAAGMLFLKDFGFEKMPPNEHDYWRDKQLKEIYRHQTGIDIQVVYDVETKFKAQELIKNAIELDQDLDLKFYKLSGSDRNAFWNRAYRIVSE